MTDLTPCGCEICGSTADVKQMKAWLMGRDLRMCFVCFCIWYDDGVTEPEKIKAIATTRRYASQTGGDDAPYASH